MNSSYSQKTHICQWE